MKKITKKNDIKGFDCDECGCSFDTDERYKSTYMDKTPLHTDDNLNPRGQYKCIKAICPNCRQEIIQ